ncbi:MAG: hypothetical protein U0795_16550 [Pirellulales bacterium]
MRRRGWLGVVGSPWTWLPVGAGVLLAVVGGGWAAPLAWAGWAAAAAGLGWAGWRLTRGRAKAERAAAEQLRRELSHRHREYLRDLRGQVREAGDGRTTDLIRALGESFDRLLQQGIFEEYDEKSWHAEVRTKLASLYRSAVDWIERSIELTKAQQRVQSESARTKLVQEREALGAEIDTTVQQLTQTLDRLEMERLDREVPEQQLSQMRAELDRGLEVARRVDERLEALDREVAGRDRE